MKQDNKSNEFRSGGRDRTPEQENSRDMDADKLGTELAQEPAVDAGDIERANKESVKTGARYGGRDSGLGINGTNDPPKS